MRTAVLFLDCELELEISLMRCCSCEKKFWPRKFECREGNEEGFDGAEDLALGSRGAEREEEQQKYG